MESEYITMNLREMERVGHNLMLKIMEKYIKEGEKGLEIGCGDEKLMNILSKKFHLDIICADPYAHGKRVFNVKGEEISSLKRKFDFIYSVMSLHHIANIKKFFEEAKKSLRKEGKIMIVDWKKGVETGVYEEYFSLQEVLNLISQYFHLLEWGNDAFHFYIVAKY